MTDDKDALEELKRLRTEVQRDADFLRSQTGRNTAGSQDCYVQDLDAAIAAWEKERADAGETNEALAACQAQGSGAMASLTALRAAVEKVRDELIQTINVRPGAVMACHLREAADALDAALRGEGV